MDVYQASDGGLYRLDKDIRDYDSIDQVYQDVSTATAVADHDVLLLTEDGKELNSDVLYEMRNQAGPSYQSGPQRRVYMYNRETFWSDSEMWAVQYQEDVQLPPPLELSDFNGIQHPFLVAHDHLSHLHSLYEAQSGALQTAYANLTFHLKPVLDEFESFSSRVEREFRKEEELIRGSKMDMAILPKLVINQSMLRKRDEEKKTKTIGDYVHAKKMEQVRESCRVLHVESVDRYNGLATKLDELSLQSNAETDAFNDRSAEAGIEFSEGLARIEVALSQLGQLTGSGAADIEQDIAELDQAMRDDLIALTAVKNEFTFDIHLHLRQVAHYQSQITLLVDSFRKFDADLPPMKDRTAFTHLQRLHHIPFAYATAVSETVRRKDFGLMLVEWTKRLKTTLSAFTQGEMKRRESVNKEWISLLPFSIPGLTEGAGPKVDVTVVSGAEGLAGMTFGYEEVEKLVQWLEQMRSDPEVIGAMEDGNEDRLSAIQLDVEGLLSKLDTAGDDLDRMVEKGVLHPRSQARSMSNSRTMLHLSSQLRAANKEKTEHVKIVQELEEAHQARIRDLEAQHEQRTAALQIRQGELQEELVRLREDLSEEMGARQALSAELEERSREQDDKVRDQEDQQDALAALQAEHAQEKNRATDLGVRLQEALLDVDGLRNVEQTLLAQIQELQVDKQTASEKEGEMRSATRDAETQLAELKAKLEVATEKLSNAQEKRDTASKDQSAEADNPKRDNLAETDGDKGVPI